LLAQQSQQPTVRKEGHRRQSDVRLQEIPLAAIIVLGGGFLWNRRSDARRAVNAAWLVIAAVCVYFIAFRLYGLFIANKCSGQRGAPNARLSPQRRLDYVPTNR